VTVLAHPVTWAAPRPLWSAGSEQQRAPSILRFASDEFMDQLLGMLASDPDSMTRHVAKYETWRTVQGDLVDTDSVDRTPMPAPIRKARLLSRLKSKPAAVAAPSPAFAKPPVLKLYQPAHQRYYVVTATLACAVPGLPDRKPAGANEQVSFVMRRLLPVAGVLTEHAYVKTPEGWKWQRLAGDDPQQLAPAEDRLGLFPLNHQDAVGLRRSLWGGLVPVGKREEYLGAALSKQAPSLLEGQLARLKIEPPASRGPSKQARLVEFRLDFAEPWKALIRSAIKAADDIAADTGDGSSGPLRQKRLREKNWDYQTQSWLLLTDLMAFFSRHLKPVHAAIISGSTAGLSVAEKDLFDWLSQSLPLADRTHLANGFAGAGLQLPMKPTMAAALKELSKKSVVDKLESVETVYRAHSAEQSSWPDFHYLLAGIGSNDGNGAGAAAAGAHTMLSGAPTPATTTPEIMDTAPPLTTPPDSVSGVAFDLNLVDQMSVMVGRALTNQVESDARELPFAYRLSQTMRETAADTGLFVIRFVHVNEDCGPLHPPTMSQPTEAFQLASFFDSDAPARPIRITLPTDTTPAGLRKHAKGTAFVLSDILCGQVQRAKGLGFIDLVLQVLPWPFHKDIDVGDGAGCKSGGVDIGMICSISIPIITLCALILLMIIISLLDFIFRWIPWFITCFPVPGLKSKAPAS
jgi:hypothetical protein